MSYASDQAPSGLTALTTLASDDTIIVGDTSDASEVVKKITKANLITDLTSDFATDISGKQDILSEGAFVDGDKTKLDGIEASADVTDTTNVTAAGAVMDSEVTNLAQVKAFDSSDYATAAQGSTADTALQDITGENLTDLADVDTDKSKTPADGDVLTFDGTDWNAETPSGGGGTVDVVSNVATDRILGRTTAGSGDSEELTASQVRTLINVEDGATADQTGAEIKSAYEAEADTNAFTDSEKTKLSGIEASADVTDTANVTAAGALMDSEVDADIKTLSLPASTTISTFGASLVDDATAGDARTTLGVDPAGTDNSTDVTLAGTPDYITITGQTITRNAINLTTDVTGDLPVADGGTGASTAAGALTNLGLTATAAEINFVDGVTSNVQTQLDSKLNSSLTIEPATDDSYEGISSNDINAGATIAQWELVYLDATPDWNLTDASAEATAGPVQVALATEAGSAASPLNVLFSGVARNDAWTWTAGGAIYMSETAGALTQTAPTTTDSVTRVLGYALSDDAIYFNPSNDWVVHV